MEPKPKDAGLWVMFVLLLLGTLLMAWVTDQPVPEKASAISIGQSR